MPKCFNGGPSYPLQENKSHDNTDILRTRMVGVQEIMLNPIH